MSEIRITVRIHMCLMSNKMLYAKPASLRDARQRNTADMASTYVPVESCPEGGGEQAWATWQLLPHSTLVVSGRSMTINPEVVHGGELRDLSLAADITLHPEWQLRLEDQIERWRFPLLSATSQWNDVLTSQLSYRPVARTKP
jgi:hypothetical protein